MAAQNKSEAKMEAKNTGELKRGLKPRHLNMIAIGGAIGTGLFLASGGTVAQAGPGGALVAYSVIGVMVYFLMTSLGEMATFMPVSGSFETYASRFVDPAFGFAIGWNYWYNWAITVAVEMVAGSIIMKYWFPGVPAAVWSVTFLVLLFLLNMMSAKAYGESEFWFAGIKVVAVIVFLIVGVAMIFGIIGGTNVGFSNFTFFDAATGARGPFPFGAKGVIMVFLIAGFSFQGTELVGIAAGESEDPDKNVPRAIKSVFWRIIIFYLGAIFVISALIPFTQAGVDTSSFTTIFERAGIAGAASLMNAVVLTSVLSCGNSGMYAASRMLYAMAREGRAPKGLAKVNSRGVPVNALVLTTLVASASFLVGIFAQDTVYLWLVAASGLAGFIAWLGIAICHYRFRKAFTAQGKDTATLKYKAALFPFGPIFALVLCIIVILGQGVSYFTAAQIDWTGIMASYIGLPIFIILYVVYKVKYKTKLVDLKEADFSVEPIQHEE